jgi:hypothetical protein
VSSVSDLQKIPLAVPVAEYKVSVIERNISHEPNAHYKNKLRATLVNDGQQCLEFSMARWIAERDEVPAKVPFGTSFVLERIEDRDLGPWHKETHTEVHVRPKQRVSTWIGLEETFTIDELKRRLDEGRLGTLVLPLRIGSVISEARFKF